MSWTCLSDKTVRTRKSHKCFGCERRMPPGTEMRIINGVDSGEFVSTRYCPVCVVYMRDYTEHWDEWCAGDFRDSDVWEPLRMKIEEGE